MPDGKNTGSGQEVDGGTAPDSQRQKKTREKGGCAGKRKEYLIDECYYLSL
ncbi:hypothetical protein KDA_75240 [Dictyobacter alpinus]|uniref:Uncharacterized protein n=1 Tax=Dictyobacter alpinus TaxID=2014873 RepID=A0A402BL49_9CHLR|nr:hypothetical protein [Dictyobacter alpinus]GCE32040.1 hypothetical protein KDA_75240 [Dictyobacter alpinus]